MIDEEGRLRRIDHGDRVYFDSFRGIAGTTYPIGTPGMPSDVIADVITILTARNLHTINVEGALLLGATMNDYCFHGNFHESAGDIVNLGGQDVDDSHFEGLIITGVQGGAGFATYEDCLFFSTIPIPMTGFRGLARRCSIFGGLTLATGNTDFADFDHCTSVHGVATVIIGSPDRVSFKDFSGGLILSTQAAGAAFVRGISGYLEIDEMTGGTLDIYTHGADIQINADCTGGTINIYGNARVIDNSAAGCTVNIHTIQAESGVPIEGTYSLPNDVAENLAFTITPIGTRQISTIMLDLSNLVQNADIRVRYDMHGDGAPFPVMETFNWTVGMDDIVYFRAISGQRAVQVTVQSTVAQGAVLDIDYEYVLG